VDSEQTEIVVVVVVAEVVVAAVGREYWQQVGH